MKDISLFAISMFGSAVSFAFGRDALEPVYILLVFMLLDYSTGILKAACHSSNKTKNGSLSSKACFQGLIKKFAILIVVILSHVMDIMFSTQGDVIRNGAALFYSLNEILSIVENMAMIGIPIPEIILDKLEIAKEKEDGK